MPRTTATQNAASAGLSTPELNSAGDRSGAARPTLSFARPVSNLCASPPKLPGTNLQGAAPAVCPERRLARTCSMNRPPHRLGAQAQPSWPFICPPDPHRGHRSHSALLAGSLTRKLAPGPQSPALPPEPRPGAPSAVNIPGLRAHAKTRTSIPSAPDFRPFPDEPPGQARGRPVFGSGRPARPSGKLPRASSSRNGQRARTGHASRLLHKEVETRRPRVRPRASNIGRHQLKLGRSNPNASQARPHLVRVYPKVGEPGVDLAECRPNLADSGLGSPESVF